MSDDGVRRGALMAGILLMAVAGAWWLGHRSRHDKGWSRAEPTSRPSAVASQATHPRKGPLHVMANAKRSFPVQHTARDRRLRDQMRKAIYRAYGKPMRQQHVGPHPAPALPAATDPFAEAGTLDKDYIQDRVRQDFVPMAKVCYESALAQHPGLTGKVVIDFEIVGDESIGGIVESAEATDGGTLTDPDLVECLRQSMLSMGFKPPEHGGRVTVTYPFNFSPDSPDGSTDH